MSSKADGGLNAMAQIMADSFVWAGSLPEGMAVAACLDTGLITDNDLAMSLGEAERERLKLISDEAERRHFVFRRCFQRVFLSTMLQWKGPPNALRIEHGQDMQTRCLDAPFYHLSFSSSGSLALACGSPVHKVGIDVEIIRSVANATALAQRFFTPAEAAEIASAPDSQQGMRFLKHWTAKEAGLKAMGQGIVSGLNTVVLRPEAGGYRIEIEDKNSSPHVWNLVFPDILPNAIVAVVHRLSI